MANEMKSGSGNQNMKAGSAGPSGSHQGGSVKQYLPAKSIKQKSGNKSQNTGK